MDHFKNIYANKAAEYHKMIEAEDVDGALFKTLKDEIPLEGKRILDIGSGTGRIPIMLNHITQKIVGIDLNFPMLVEQNKKRQELHGNWFLLCGDMRCLPVVPDMWDVVIAGWAIGHLRSWFEGDWQNQIGMILEEMHRVTRKGGTLIICETLSTGSLAPAPPNQELAMYYHWLETKWGFKCQVIQTDYLFDSVDEAVNLTEFFFGSDLADTIRQNNWIRLPEWTGVWSKSTK